LAGASGYTVIESPSREMEWKNVTYLSWYVILKVSGVLRIAEFRAKWGRISVNVGPVNPTKERMSFDQLSTIPPAAGP